MDLMIKLIEELVKLIGNLAWPISILVIIYLIREQLRSLIDRIGEKIKDPLSDVSFSKAGLEIKHRTDAALGIIESLREEVNALKQKVFSTQKIAAEPLDFSETRSFEGHIPEQGEKAESHDHTIEPGAIDDKLRNLAEEYLAICSTDRSEQVREKGILATKLGNYVTASKTSRDLLARENNEGLILALASAINSFPENGDLDRLFWVKDRVTRLHVKYWIVMAIGRIFERRMMKQEDIKRAQQILDFFAVGADKSLQNRILQTRSIIDFSKWACSAD